MAESNATQVILTDDGLKIIKAQSTADSAADGFANLNDPNLMSVIEKQSNVSQFAGLTSQYNVILQNAKDDGIDTTAVTTAYNNLNRFMASVLADPDHAGDVDRVTYKKYQDAYNEELADLQNALQNNANNKFASAASATSQAASTASQAFNQAQSAVDYVNSETAVQSAAIGEAQSAASDAVSKAESTASEFGKVDQRADSAFDNAMSAQSAASDAVEQASSAAVDSKDAKQIAGAVSQSYKTLTDGSTMTIAELQSGLAVKLTKSDLDGYATQDWAQNQIKTTADGINGTISSIKGTVDSHTTSINTLQADSNGFKTQFDTVNGTLNTQSTNIGTLQASSKELSSNFSSLNTDNNTNKNDISELKQTATKVSSTLETVQTQVQNSAVGTNLLTNTGDLSVNWCGATSISATAEYDGHPSMVFASSPSAWQLASQQFSLGKLQNSTQYTASFWAKADNAGDKAHTELWGSNGATDFVLTTNWVRYTAVVTSASDANTNTDHSVCYFGVDAGNTGNVYIALPKLEKGSMATDWCPNPADNATVTAVSSISQTIDGMKSDISKKIESKDLDGYATQTWAQNQINTTANGINGTISSVKNTVDGYSTTINNLQADSKSFKDQFTTVNGTLNTQSTDIGTLQASSKSLSSNFDSLSSDNKTNQHDIGQLQASAKEFNNTLTTVQTQVQNSAVGTNLLTNTSDLSANWSLNGIVDTSQKPAVLHYPMTTLTSSVNNIANQQLNDGLFQPSTTYTASFHAKGTGTMIFYCYPAVTTGGGDNHTNIKLTNDYKLYTITFTTAPDISGGKNFLLRQDYSPSETDQNSVEAYIYGFKLEKGSLATDYSVNPSDTATQSQISQLSSDINFRVKKDDLISQINVQARNILISTSGQLTLAADTVLFDTDKPVIIPSANIETVLVRKQLQAADISANTFTTNNGTFTVKQDGSITAKNMTLTGGTLTTPTINAGIINGSTINGTTFHGGDISSNSNNTANYYPMTITPDGTYKSTYFDSAVGLQASVESGAIAYKYRSMIGNGQYLAYDSVINGQGLDLQSGYTSAKDTTFSNPVSTTTGYVIVNANDGITLHGDDQQITFNGTSADVTPKGVIITPYGNINPNGTQNIWYVGNNMNMKTASFGMDGSGTYNIQFNRSLDIGNFNINTYHTITSSDNGPIHFNRNDGKSVDIYASTVHYDSLVKSSLLSLKKDVQKANTAYWAQLVNSIDLATYQYKSDDNTSHIRLSSIVDDVNDTKQWQLPDVFVSRDENGKLNGVDDSVLLNATLATVQEQQKEIDQLNGHLLELEAKLNG